jgi:hypothetical protein
MMSMWERNPRGLKGFIFSKNSTESSYRILIFIFPCLLAKKADFNSRFRMGRNIESPAVLVRRRCPERADLYKVRGGDVKIYYFGAGEGGE